MACDNGNCSGDVGRVGVAESRERTKKSPQTRKKCVSSHKSNTHTQLSITLSHSKEKKNNRERIRHMKER